MTRAINQSPELSNLLDMIPFFSSEDNIEDDYNFADYVAPLAFFLYDKQNCKFIYLSNSINKIIGYSKSQLLDGGIYFLSSIVFPNDYEKYKQVFLNDKFSHGHELFKSLSFRIIHSRGYVVWVEFNYFILVDTYKEVTGKVFGIIHDVSKQKQAEEFLWERIKNNVTSSNDLRKIKRKYQQLFNNQHYKRTQSEQCKITRIPIHHKGESNVISIREKEILQLIAQGYLTKQIAAKLGISSYTVTSHRKKLIAKFKVKNTAELIKEACKYFWL